MATVVAIDKKIDASLQTMNHINAKLEQQTNTFRKVAYQGIDQNIDKTVSGLSIFMFILISAVTVGVLLGIYIIRSIIGPINRIIGGFSEAADQVASAADQISSSSQTLAEGSSEQAAAIEETSSSLEEMSSMTRQNADHASQADDLMQEANQVVAQANESMLKLTGSAPGVSFRRRLQIRLPAAGTRPGVG